MEIIIRREEKKDQKKTELLVREAFWDVYKPGCDEHLVLHKLRDSAAFVKELDLVACTGNEVVGIIVYSKAKVINDSKEWTVLCMGPLAVDLPHQDKGIGTMLLKDSLEKARELGYRGVVIFGKPEYYQRFGFQNANKFNIKTSDGQNFDAFMALELQKDGLKDISGRFVADPVFEVDMNELNEFEKQFPFKEKHTTDTQLKHN